VHSRGGRDLLPEDYPEFSSEEDEDELSRGEAQRSARKQKVGSMEVQQKEGAGMWQHLSVDGMSRAYDAALRTQAVCGGLPAHAAATGQGVPAGVRSLCLPSVAQHAVSYQHSWAAMVRQLTSCNAMLQRYVARRGPNSDDFIPVKGGSDFGGHSRGGSLGGKEESVFDPEEALLAKVHLKSLSSSSSSSRRMPISSSTTTHAA
jgi:hypothetical protein